MKYENCPETPKIPTTKISKYTTSFSWKIENWMDLAESGIEEIKSNHFRFFAHDGKKSRQWRHLTVYV